MWCMMRRDRAGLSRRLHATARFPQFQTKRGSFVVDMNSHPSGSEDQGLGILQLALEMSALGLNPKNEADKITKEVEVPNAHHVAQIVGPKGGLNFI